jgi:hypothetical protein
MFVGRSLLSLLFAFLPLTLAAEPAQLVAEADQASASVRPADAGNKVLRLPDLTYQIGIEARCNDGESAESLSISIADTRMTLFRDELADKSIITVGITVPASQVAPLAADGFCLLEDFEHRKRLINDAFTANLSLRCRGEEGESIIYASRPLAVALTCDRDVQGDSDSSTLR